MAKPTTKELARTFLALSERMPQDKLATSIASYLQQERRSDELDAIMRGVKEIRQKQTGMVEADITSAFPINDNTVKQIKQLLGDNVILNKTIDKEVIGGVRVETTEQYLDLTVRNRLNKLKRTRQGVA